MLHKIRLLLILIIFSTLTNTNAQKYIITDINPQHFPMVQAKILALSPDYSKYKIDNSPAFIIEDSIPITPFEFSPPKSTVIPSSIVMVLDVSGSMEGRKFEILKKTAIEFINLIPLDRSEVAIVSFNNNVIVNSDFSQNKNTLTKSIDKLITGGATDFNRALMTEYTGAVSLASKGKYKKMIIFITDGISNINPNSVAKLAQKDSTIINCITIGLPISNELKTIARETDGKFYSNLNNEVDIKQAFEKIYTDFQTNTYGTVKWYSNFSCLSQKEFALHFDKQIINEHYAIPGNMSGTVIAIPSSISFKKTTPGQTVTTPVLIKGVNTGIHITSVTNSNDTRFGIIENTFPINADINKGCIINLTYTPLDTIYSTSIYTVKIPGCPDVSINATSGGTKKLLLTHPSGGEILTGGDTDTIKWVGIDKSTPVELFYQSKTNSKLINIGTNNNLNYSWITPQINNKIRIIGTITNNITEANLLNSSFCITDTTTFRVAFFSPDGKQVITISENGIMRNYDYLHKKLNFTFEETHLGDVVFFPYHNRLVSFSNDNALVLTNRNGMVMKKVPLKKQGVFSSFTYTNNKELYLAMDNYMYVSQFMKKLPGGAYTTATTSPLSRYIISKTDTKINIIRKDNYKKLFSIPIGGSFKRALLHNSKEYLIVETNLDFSLYNIKNKILIKTYNSQFNGFTPYPKYFTAINNKFINFYLLSDGTLALKIKKQTPYAVNKNTPLIAFSKNDSLFVKDINMDKYIVSQNMKDIDSIFFINNINKLLIIQKSQILIYNVNAKTIEYSAYVSPNIIKHVDVAPDNNTFLITTDNIVATWQPNTKTDSDTTKYFTIVSPTPDVVESVNFGKCYTNKTHEHYFIIATNNSKRNITIDTLYLKNNKYFSIIYPYGKMILAPNSSLKCEIHFTPEQPIIYTDTLFIKSGTYVLKCTLNGEGKNINYTLPSPIIRLSSVNVFQHSDSTFPIIANTGSEPLNITNITIDNSVFLSKNINKQILKHGDTLFYNVTFTPKQRGLQSGNITTTINGDNITTTQLSGYGKAKKHITISGYTTNASSGEHVASEIVITELSSGFITKRVKTNSNGKYTIVLNTDLNYSISANCNNYFSSSLNINLSEPQFSDTLYADIDLYPIKDNSKITLHNIFFETGSAKLMKTSEPELNRIILLMQKYENINIIVQGHTDNTGTASSNQILSQKRAKAVKNFITDNNINKNRIAIEYYGETQPLNDNSTEYKRQQNRRVEIIIKE